MGMADPLMGELAHEGATTRRVLERVPEDKLSWKPHDKSMSLGQLALHIARIPGSIAYLLKDDTFEGTPPPPAEATSREQLLAAHDEALLQAKAALGGWGDEALAAQWSFVRGGKTMMAAPRGAMVRSLMLNHWYHHRGQLTVYLRLLGVPLPSVYGPSADENPFG